MPFRPLNVTNRCNPPRRAGLREFSSRSIGALQDLKSTYGEPDSEHFLRGSSRRNRRVPIIMEMDVVRNDAVKKTKQNVYSTFMFKLTLKLTVRRFYSFLLDVTKGANNSARPVEPRIWKRARAWLSTPSCALFDPPLHPSASSFLSLSVTAADLISCSLLSVRSPPLSMCSCSHWCRLSALLSGKIC